MQNISIISGNVTRSTILKGNPVLLYVVYDQTEKSLSYPLTAPSFDTAQFALKHLNPSNISSLTILPLIEFESLEDLLSLTLNPNSSPHQRFPDLFPGPVTQNKKEPAPEPVLCTEGGNRGAHPTPSPLNNPYWKDALPPKKKASKRAAKQR